MTEAVFKQDWNIPKIKSRRDVVRLSVITIAYYTEAQDSGKRLERMPVVLNFRQRMLNAIIKLVGISCNENHCVFS